MKREKSELFKGVEVGEFEVDSMRVSALKDFLNKIVKTSRILTITGNPISGVVVIHRKVKFR